MCHVHNPGVGPDRQDVAVDPVVHDVPGTDQHDRDRRLVLVDGLAPTQWPAAALLVRRQVVAVAVRGPGGEATPEGGLGSYLHSPRVLLRVEPVYEREG